MMRRAITRTNDFQDFIQVMDSSLQPQITLSLKKWPPKPSQTHRYRLTPISKKVIHQSGIGLEEIVPKHFEDFAHNKQLQQFAYETLLEKYHHYEQRRLRKIALLQKMREEYLQQERRQIKNLISKSNNGLKSTKSTKLTNRNSSSKSKEKGKLNNSNPKHSKHRGFNPKHIEKHRPCENSHADYFGNIRKHASSKTVYFKKVQRSKQKNGLKGSKDKYLPIPQYYDTPRSKKDRTLKSGKLLKKQLHIVEQMQRYLAEWNALDFQHQKEINEHHLGQKQLRRLQKIHYIEKQQLRYKMEKMRGEIQIVSKSLKGNQLFKSF